MEKEREFYEGLFLTLKSERLEINPVEADLQYPVVNKDIGLSINREKRLQRLLDILGIEIKEKVRTLPIVEKIALLDGCLKNAKYYRDTQIKDFNKDVEEDKAYSDYENSEEYETDKKEVEKLQALYDATMEKYMEDPDTNPLPTVDMNPQIRYHKTENFKYHLKKASRLYWTKPIAHQNIGFVNAWIEAIEEMRFKANGHEERTGINPLDSIDPALIEGFKKIEKKVISQDGKWLDSDVRLAAFCELLYEKKYFTEKPNKNKNRPVQFIAAFAKRRYTKDIGTALKAAKKVERDDHKNKKKNRKPSLISLFD